MRHAGRVHSAHTRIVATSGIHITISVVANGSQFQFGDMNNATELFLGANSIWRVNGATNPLLAASAHNPNSPWLHGKPQEC